MHQHTLARPNPYYPTTNTLVIHNIGNDLEQLMVTNIDCETVIFDEKCDFNRVINVLPRNIKCLRFGVYFNQTIILPKTIIELVFGWSFNKSVNLPNSIKHLVFCENFNQKIHLPKSLTNVKFGWFFNQPVRVTNRIITLVFDCLFDQPVFLPDKILYITFDGKYDHMIVLPKRLIYLKVGVCFNRHIVLPKTIKTLSIGSRFDEHIELPESLEHLTMYCLHEWLLDNLPNVLKYLVLSNIRFNIGLFNVGNMIDTVDIFNTNYKWVMSGKVIKNLRIGHDCTYKKCVV